MRQNHVYKLYPSQNVDQAVAAGREATAPAMVSRTATDLCHVLGVALAFTLGCSRDCWASWLAGMAAECGVDAGPLQAAVTERRLQPRSAIACA